MSFPNVEHNGEVRVPSVAVCRKDDCKFEWVFAYTPMEMGAWAKLAQHTGCPMCGDTKPLLKGS